MTLQKLIIDTDMGSDCDDVPAVALAAWMQKTGQAKLLGLTHTSDNPRLYEYIDSVTRFYGGFNAEITVCDGDCPEIGKLSDEFVDKVVKGFAHRKAPEKNFGSTKLLRKLLAENEGVKLICIGPLNNIAALLKSGADEYSPLTGEELVAKSVEEVALMGGIFGGKEYWFGGSKMESEFNIRCDIPAAAYVLEHCKAPVTFIEFELGNGVESFERTAASSVDSPIKRSFEVFGVKKRSSWDPITVLYTQYGDCGGLYKFSPYGTAKVEPDGKLTFTEGAGKHRYLIENASKQAITDYINSFEEKLSGGNL